MQGDSVKRNIYFQFLYQVLVLIIPLVLAPYLTRTLGDTALGIYSFTYSVGQIFVVVANLGIAKYGQRLIAEKKNNSEQLRKTFWSLFVVHAIVSLTVFAGFMLFSFLWGGQRRDNFLIQGFYVLSAFFDITWLYYGIEKFKGVVIRNTVVKLLELVLIFSFVHSPSDLNKYTLIMSSSVMMGMAMGGAMGGQMGNMMNRMGQQMQQASMPQQPQQQAQPQMTPPPMPGAVNVAYLVSVNGQQFGPYNMQQLQQLVQNGQLTSQTYVWKQGMPNWEFAGNVQELANLFGAVPPPMPPAPPMP